MIDTDMDEIIPGLYVGGWHAARDICAAYLPISIVTVAVDSEVIGERHFKLIDGPGNDALVFLGAVGIVAQHIQNSSPVLVHCVAGRSRAAAVAIGALMKSRDMNLCEAYDLVKSKRNIQIHPAFAQLMELCAK